MKCLHNSMLAPPRVSMSQCALYSARLKHVCGIFRAPGQPRCMYIPGGSVLPVLKVAPLHHVVTNRQPRGAQHTLVRRGGIRASLAQGTRGYCLGVTYLSAEESHQGYHTSTFRGLEWISGATQKGNIRETGWRGGGVVFIGGLLS